MAYEEPQVPEPTWGQTIGCCAAVVGLCVLVAVVASVVQAL